MYDAFWVGNFWQPPTLFHAVYVLVNAMSVDDKRKCPVVITVSIGAAIGCSLRSLLTISDDDGTFSRVKTCQNIDMRQSLTLIISWGLILCLNLILSSRNCVINETLR